MNKRILSVYQRAKRMEIDAHSKIVLFSDLHRGSGGGGDGFAKNEELFYAALQHYLREGYTYIELGDGDELWKEGDMAGIVGEYEHIFRLLVSFHTKGRFIMLSGNHDFMKRDKNWVREHLEEYKPRHGEQVLPLFPEISVEEAILLHYLPADQEILLLHGHQGDFFNSHLIRFGRLCVRYLWQPLEFLGLRNPFDAGQNHRRQSKVERNLKRFSQQNTLPIIAGHTHRPKFPKEGETSYFNTGSGIHTRYITGFEITEGKIRQIRWELMVRVSGSLFVGREVLSESRALGDL